MDLNAWRDMPESERHALLAKAYGRAATDLAVTNGYDAETSARIGRATGKGLAARLAKHTEQR